MDEITLWIIITLLTGLQGVFLSLAILVKSKGKRMANRLLSIFILLISLTMIGRLSFYYAENENDFLPGGLVDIIIFCYGPLAYFYLSFLLKLKNDWHRRDIIHAIPLLLYLVYFFYRLFFSSHFENSWMNTYLHQVFFFLELVAVIQNAAYAYWCYKTLKKYEATMAESYSTIPQLKYIRIFLALVAVIIILWAYGFVSKYIESLHFTTVLSYNFVWILLSCLTFLFAYFSYFDANILATPLKTGKYEQGYASPDHYSALKNQLETFMSDKKPFLNPQLSLSDLSTQIGANQRDVSRVINEHFGQNFYEFVNSYRIREFKNLVKKDRNKTYTILTLAYDSGFNSKATFNAAFKKRMNITPSEYIQRTEA